MPRKWNQKVIKKIKFNIIGIIFTNLTLPFFLLSRDYGVLEQKHIIGLVIYSLLFGIIYDIIQVKRTLKLSISIEKMRLNNQTMEISLISHPFVNWFRKLFSFRNNFFINKNEFSSIQIKETNLLRNELADTGFKIYSLILDTKQKTFILLSDNEFISLKDHLDRFRKNVE